MYDKICAALHIDALRDFQQQALDALTEGHDALILMPTSAGKSVVFQGLAIETEKLIVVVEPHLALELDQVAGLQDKGIPAACLNSLQSVKEQQQVLTDIERGKLRLLYLTPEMLQNANVQQTLLAVNIAGVMVDEAHCLYKQGPGFREAYLKIANFIHKLPTRPPVGAFTATATNSTEAYIIKHLGMNDPIVIRGPVTRDNITLNVIPISDELGGIKDAALIEQHKRKIIREWLKHTDGQVIVYSNTIERVESLCAHLRKKGFAADYYHGKCEDKPQRLRRFREGKTRIMVATNAFGLGVNIPDIRLVIHHAPLIGLDDYLQEVGRAGRDGEKSKALLLWHPYDFTLNRSLIRKNQLNLTGKELRDRLDALHALEQYAKDTDTCRWQLIRKFFGEKKGKKCKKRCDNCK